MTHPVTWRKSTYSINGSNCVELARAGGAVWLRDSTHPEQGHLTLNPAEVAALIAAAKSGELDDLAPA
jgi:hypothetical protein